MEQNSFSAGFCKDERLLFESYVRLRGVSGTQTVIVGLFLGKQPRQEIQEFVFFSSLHPPLQPRLNQYCVRVGSLTFPQGFHRAGEGQNNSKRK